MSPSRLIAVPLAALLLAAGSASAISAEEAYKLDNPAFDPPDERPPLVDPTLAEIAAAKKDPKAHPAHKAFLARAAKMKIPNDKAEKLWADIVHGILGQDPAARGSAVAFMSTEEMMHPADGKGALWSGFKVAFQYAVMKGKQPLEAQPFYHLTHAIRFMREKEDWECCASPFFADLSRNYVKKLRGMVHIYLRRCEGGAIFKKVEWPTFDVTKATPVFHLLLPLTGPDEKDFKVKPEDIHEVDLNGKPLKGEASPMTSPADIKKAIAAATDACPVLVDHHKM